MKGLTIDQFKEITEFVQQHHRFCLFVNKEDQPARKAQFPNLPEERGFGIKYIDSCYDSRDSTFWSISFRQGRYGICFSAHHYNPVFNPAPKNFKYTNLYDLCMDYLKGNFEPTKDFYLDTQEPGEVRPNSLGIKHEKEGVTLRNYLGMDFHEIMEGDLDNLKVYYEKNGERFDNLGEIMKAIQFGHFNKKHEHIRK